MIEPITKLLWDAAILVALVVALGPKERPKYPMVVAGAAGVGLAFAIYDFLARVLPAWLLGYLIVVPIILTGVMLVRYGRLRLKQATIATGLFILARLLTHLAVKLVF